MLMLNSLALHHSVLVFSWFCAYLPFVVAAQLFELSGSSLWKDQILQPKINPMNKENLFFDGSQLKFQSQQQSSLI